MKKIAVTLLTIVVMMLALDAVWIGVIANTMYREGIGHLMLDAPHIPSALLFYAVYAAGLLVFVVAPHPVNGTDRVLLQRAALYGFFAYATYDLTNLATLKGWPLHVSLVDMAWGAALSAACAWVAFRMWRWLGRS